MPVEKRNIILNDITERMAYKSSAHPITKKYPTRQDYAAHRYPSCGLRFEINKVNQSPDEFKKQVSKMAAEEDKAEDATSDTANDWYLGPKNRNVGSVHSDFIVCNAVDLCERNYVAVYPIGGWWKERPYLKKTDNKVKYALVVSLETPSVEIDLYTPIINVISTVVPVTVPIYSEEEI